jgi:hypothetical protein
MNAHFWIERCCLIAITAATFIPSSTHADTPAFVLGTFLTNQPPSFTGTRGLIFSLNNPNVAVSQLGVFDNGGDGLENSHQVGLWRLDPATLQGTLLASATVPAGTTASLIGGYRFVPISPVSFGPLDLGVVAGQYSTGDGDDLVTPVPSLNFPGALQIFPPGRFGLGTGLPYPDQGLSPPCTGCSAPIFWEANFQFQDVPEPSVGLLLLPGLTYLLLRHRRSQ